MGVMGPDELVRREQAAWRSPDTIAYYESHRLHPDDLYDTERFFLPQILPQIKSVLDVGCAAGGFGQIMRSFNPKLHYSGVDITPELIDVARKKYPSDDFAVSDGLHFPYKAGSFDLVHCSGVLHLNSQYREMVKAMWAQTKRYLLCDFRLSWGPEEVGQMELAFGGSANPKNVLPYHVVNMNNLMDFLRNLEPRPGAIRAKGYSHAVAPSTRIKTADVIMAFFLLEKSQPGPLHMELNLEIK